MAGFMELNKTGMGEIGIVDRVEMVDPGVLSTEVVGKDSHINNEAEILLYFSFPHVFCTDNWTICQLLSNKSNSTQRATRDTNKIREIYDEILALE